MAYTVTIDWLSFTMHDERGITNVLQTLNPSGIMDAAKPKFGYDWAARTQDGASVLSQRNGGSMGTHFIIPGSALRALSERGVGGLRILAQAVTNGAKITRVDLAKDAQDEKFELIQFAQTVSSGGYTGTAQKASVVRSSDGGCTLYIGSRQSERFVRVYDKGIESGQGGDWVRLEMETKGDVANIIAKALCDGQSDINTILCRSVERMCDTDNEQWRAMLRSDADWSAAKVEKSSDTEKWVETQVANAVLNHLDQHPESAAVRRLYELLKERIEKGD